MFKRSRHNYKFTFVILKRNNLKDYTVDETDLKEVLLLFFLSEKFQKENKERICKKFNGE